MPEPGQDRRQRVQQRNECRACSCRPRRQQEQGPARRCAESDRELERDSRPSWSVQRPPRGGRVKDAGRRGNHRGGDELGAGKPHASLDGVRQPARGGDGDGYRPHRTAPIENSSVASSSVSPPPAVAPPPRLAVVSTQRPARRPFHARTHARTNKNCLAGWPDCGLAWLAWPGLAWPAVGQAVSCARSSTVLRKCSTATRANQPKSKRSALLRFHQLKTERRRKRQRPQPPRIASYIQPPHPGGRGLLSSAAQPCPRHCSCR